MFIFGNRVSKTPKAPNAQIQILGVYRITPTEESIVEAARYHECPWLLDERGAFTDVVSWDSLRDLGLVEMLIAGPFAATCLMQVRQGDQCPYLEYYLDSEGTSLLSVREAEQAPCRRVCFFLHFVDTGKHLAIESQLYRLPAMTALPDRLVPYTHYLPVD